MKYNIFVQIINCILRVLRVFCVNSKQFKKQYIKDEYFHESKVKETKWTTNIVNYIVTTCLILHNNILKCKDEFDENTKFNSLNIRC